MFFKKKVPLKNYCIIKFDFICSGSGSTIADYLKNQCGNNFVSQVDEATYMSHFRGAFLVLLGVAFSRTLKRNQRYDVMHMQNEYLKSKGLQKLGDLAHMYNSAFGSSPVDGIMAIAICFAENVTVEGIDPKLVAKAHHDGFKGIIIEILDDLKGIKLV